VESARGSGGRVIYPDPPLAGPTARGGTPHAASSLSESSGRAQDRYMTKSAGATLLRCSQQPCRFAVPFEALRECFQRATPRFEQPHRTGPIHSCPSRHMGEGREELVEPLGRAETGWRHGVNNTTG